MEVQEATKATKQSTASDGGQNSIRKDSAMDLGASDARTVARIPILQQSQQQVEVQESTRVIVDIFREYAEPSSPTEVRTELMIQPVEGKTGVSITEFPEGMVFVERLAGDGNSPLIEEEDDKKPVNTVEEEEGTLKSTMSATVARPLLVPKPNPPTIESRPTSSSTPKVTVDIVAQIK
ncbi:hypothetical protein L6452_02021 [Arctium lappa]|uniref:Uncharacterized protein n=1 Tax=Arctium lappa TaxID=4217 RepID=A0ACB9FHP4_ARCLA|nr:hypothetical protein L6452_02021 [Arctium lappa]